MDVAPPNVGPNTASQADPSDKAPLGVKPARSRLWRWSLRLLRLAVFTYLGLALVLVLFQTWLIFPGAATQGQKHAVIRPAEGAELVTLTASTGDKVVALFGGALGPDGRPHPDAATRPTILYFYGNGMCAADTVGEFMRLRRRGFNMMVPDYLGFGMSGGKPGEQGVFATADAAFEHLLQRKDIDPRQIVPMGWSLGAAAAIHVASTRSVPALVTVSAFTSMADMGRKNFPYLPISLLLRHRFENEKKIRDIHVPIFMAHGERDRIIPFEMSKRLERAAGGKVTRFDVTEGDHNDVFDVGGPELLNAIAAFIDQNADANRSSSQMIAPR